MTTFNSVSTKNSVSTTELNTIATSGVATTEHRSTAQAATGVRIVRTGPRGLKNPTSDFAELLATVRDAGLLRRHRRFYIANFVVVSIAMAAAWVAFAFLRGSWFELIPAAAIGFLLTQLGSLAAENFAAKTRELGITPPEAGVMRILGRQAGMNQRELAEKLGVAQSRVVALVDSLESAGLVIRERSAADRRSQVLQVTDSGRELLTGLRSAAETQESELTDGLSADDRDQLYELLLKLGVARGLDRDVHPGYRAGK